MEKTINHRDTEKIKDESKGLAFLWFCFSLCLRVSVVNGFAFLIITPPLA